MNATLRALQDKALQAHTAAKAIMDEYKDSVMPADKKEQFDGYMGDWKEAHEAFVAAQKQQEQFAELNQAESLYTAPTTPIIVPGANDGLGNAQQTPDERNAAARAAHRSAFNRFIAHGPAALNQHEMGAYMVGSRELLGANPQEALMKLLPAEKHALVGNVDSLGGFLVTDDFMSELIKELPGFTTMRRLARSRPTNSSAAVFMTVQGSGNAQYSSGLTGSFRSEGWVLGGGAPPTQNQPTFGRERVPVHIWSPDIIEITMELLADSAVNLDSELRTLLAEVRGMDEDSAFILGTGVGMPMGIVTEADAANIAAVQSGAADNQSYPGLVDLWTALPAQYRSRSTFLMNSTTLGLIMKLEDTAGNPLFPANSIPTQLFQRPIEISEFMPDGDTDDNKAIIFGDFSYYGIADRQDMRIIRLTERFAPNVGLMAVARVGGQVLKTAPFRAQNVGA